MDLDLDCSYRGGWGTAARGPSGRSQVYPELFGAPIWGLGLSLSRRAVLLEW